MKQAIKQLFNVIQSNLSNWIEWKYIRLDMALLLYKSNTLCNLIVIIIIIQLFNT